MKAYIEKEDRFVELKAKNGEELLKFLSINPNTVILVKDNEIILPDEPLKSSDSIRILSVISGG